MASHYAHAVVPANKRTPQYQRNQRIAPKRPRLEDSDSPPSFGAYHNTYSDYTTREVSRPDPQSFYYCKPEPNPPWKQWPHLAETMKAVHARDIQGYDTIPAPANVRQQCTPRHSQPKRTATHWIPVIDERGKRKLLPKPKSTPYFSHIPAAKVSLCQVGNVQSGLVRVPMGPTEIRQLPGVTITPIDPRNLVQKKAEQTTGRPNVVIVRSDNKVKTLDRYLKDEFYSSSSSNNNSVKTKLPAKSAKKDNHSKAKAREKLLNNPNVSVSTIRNSERLPLDDESDPNDMGLSRREMAMTLSQNLSEADLMCSNVPAALLVLDDTSDADPLVQLFGKETMTRLMRG